MDLFAQWYNSSNGWLCPLQWSHWRGNDRQFKCRKSMKYVMLLLGETLRKEENFRGQVHGMTQEWRWEGSLAKICQVPHPSSKTDSSHDWQFQISCLLLTWRVYGRAKMILGEFSVGSGRNKGPLILCLRICQEDLAGCFIVKWAQQKCCWLEGLWLGYKTRQVIVFNLDWQAIFYILKARNEKLVLALIPLLVEWRSKGVVRGTLPGTNHLQRKVITNRHRRLL